MRTGKTASVANLKYFWNSASLVALVILLAVPSFALAQVEEEQEGPPPEVYLSNATNYYITATDKVNTGEGDPTNDFAEAIRYFNIYLEAVPETSFEDSVSIYVKLADCYYQTSRYATDHNGAPQWEKALEYYQWLIDRNPPEADLGWNNYQAGWCKKEVEGGYGPAMPYFEKYLELRPDDLQTYVWVAQIYLSLMNNSRALDLFLFVLDKDPAYEGVVAQILNLRTRLQLRYEEVTLKLVEKVPETPQYLLDLGQFYLERARFDEGRDYVTRYLEKQPEDVAALRTLGEEEKRRGNWDAAISAFRRILSVESDNTRAQVDIADVYMQQRLIDETIDAAEVALRMDPDDPYANKVMGDAAVQWALRQYAVQYPDRELEKMMYDFRLLMKRIADEYYEKAKGDSQFRTYAQNQINYLTQFFPQPQDRFMWPQDKDPNIQFPPPR